jgi:3',5'-cyclic AMP phosphodiesterase CpdA
MDKDQQTWLEQELKDSNEAWKIAYFHHPMYSSGGRHGSEVDLRTIVEPLFIKYGVSVVFAGHEHFYERLKPQKGIAYFILGSSAKLRRGDLEKSSLTVYGNDQSYAFMLIEIDGDELYFQAISDKGVTLDAGSIRRTGEDSTGTQTTQPIVPQAKPSPKLPGPAATPKPAPPGLAASVTAWPAARSAAWSALRSNPRPSGGCCRRRASPPCR